MTGKRALATLICVFGMVTITRAEGQPQIEFELTAIPPFLRPQDELRIGLRIKNSGDSPARDLRLGISIHEPVATRSHLELTFRQTLGAPVGGDTFEVHGEVLPGRVGTLTATRPVSQISFFREATDGVYPARLTLFSSGAPFSSVDTHLVFFRRDPRRPLRLALVVPLHFPEVYRARKDPQALRALLERGPFHQILSALEDYPRAAVTLAPSGILLRGLDFLARRGPGEALAGPAAEALARMRALVSRSGVDVIAAPFAAPLLPALPPLRAQSHIRAGISAVEEILQTEGIEDALLPLPALLDKPSLAQLENSGIRRVGLRGESVSGAEQVLTPGATARIRTPTGSPMAALVADAGLSTRLDPGPELGPVVARQQLLAETAAIMLERPAVERSVAAIAPVSWRRPAVVRGLVRAMVASPWLRSARAAQVIEAPPGREVEAIPPSEPEALGLTPSDALSERLEGARTAAARFAEISPAPNRLSALEQLLMLAESADWWKDFAAATEGSAVADEVISEVEGQLSRIRPPNPQTITLTAREGEIPIAFTNGTDYPVAIEIRLESSKLEFPDASRCLGERSACIQTTLQPRVQTHSVRVIAQATGTFPLRVSIRTPRSGFLISSSRLGVRSTAYNVVAVAITAGAGAFLMTWWIAGAVRRGRKPRE